MLPYSVFGSHKYASHTFPLVLSSFSETSKRTLTGFSRLGRESDPQPEVAKACSVVLPDTHGVQVVSLASRHESCQGLVMSRLAPTQALEWMLFSYCSDTNLVNLDDVRADIASVLSLLLISQE